MLRGGWPTRSEAEGAKSSRTEILLFDPFSGCTVIDQKSIKVRPDHFLRERPMQTRISDFEISFFERLAKENPDFVDALIPLAESYTKKGLYDKGLQIDKRLARLRKNDPIVHYNLACSFALVGKKDEAITALRRAIRLGYSDFEHLKRDPDLKILRDDSRFVSLLAKKSIQV